MRMLVARSLALLALAFVLAAATPSQAQVVPLDDPGAFSGGETQIDFEDPGLFDGMAVTQFGEVALGLEDSVGGDHGGAGFGLAVEPREFGSPDAGSVNNFGVAGLPYPFPMVRFGFPALMHRVGFEARVAVEDEVVVIFRRGGVVVGQATRPNPDSGRFYFHGFELAEGFDEVLVDATENFTGALAIDNLAYEALASAPPDNGDPPAEGGEDGGDSGGDGETPPDTEPPTAGVPVLSCEGFHPMGRSLAKLRNHHARKLGRMLLKYLPYKLMRASLSDEHGVPIAWQDLLAAPVVQVVHTPLGSEDSYDISKDAVMNGNREFRHRKAGKWRKLLRGNAMLLPGTYVVTIESGDPEEYALDSCVEWIVVEPPAESRQPKWMKRWRSRFGGR